MRELERKIYAENTMIFHEGDMAYTAFLLKRGKVEISVMKEGRKIVLSHVGPNQLFGELALIDKSPRSATARALETCEVILVKQQDIERMLGGVDEFIRYWIEYLTERVRDLSKRVDD